MRIIVILSRVPFPLDKGDKLRAYHQLKEMSKKHEVYLCCLDDKNTSIEQHKVLLEFCKEVSVLRLRKWQILLNLFIGLFTSSPFQVWYFYQKHAHKKIKAIIGRVKPDHIYCQLLRTAEYAKNEHGIPKTLDYMDAFSKGVERRISTAGLLKPFFKSEYQRLVKYEHLIFEYFENKTIISEQDRDFIFHQDRNAIHIIPNGIDLEYFQPMKVVKQYDLVFVGNMSYAPNIESAVFLVNKILPLLIQKIPSIKILIAGSSPVKAVTNLASNNVEISGWVDDIRVAYASGRIFIAALNIGTGLQNKLLEAMAMEIPCVTSVLANNALKAEVGSEILIGDSPEQYADLVIDLLNDEEGLNQLASNGRKFIEQNYSWKKSTDVLSNIISSTKL